MVKWVIWDMYEQALLSRSPYELWFMFRFFRNTVMCQTSPFPPPQPPEKYLFVAFAIDIRQETFNTLT